MNQSQYMVTKLADTCWLYFSSSFPEHEKEEYRKRVSEDGI